MIREAIAKLTEGVGLTETEASQVAEEIMAGEATPAQIGAFLVSLRIKVESVAEISGMARVMREKALRVPVDYDVIDVVGTGGGGEGTFNISTAAAFVVAAAGLRVAKHNNRAASGRMGSADLLEAKGIRPDLPPEAVKRCIDEVGIGFMFAPAFHPATRHAAPVRRELGVRTIFNILGPLTNPAFARYQLVGISQPSVVATGLQPELGEMMAQTLISLGSKRAWVVRSEDGLDELTTSAANLVWEARDGAVRHFTLSVGDAGLDPASPSAFQPADAEGHVAMFDAALAREDSPQKDVVLLNAGAALAISGKVSELHEGIALAREAVDSGAAAACVRQLAELVRSFG